MEKEYDFSAYGKVNPYKTPDGFFDSLPQQTLEMAKRRAASHKRIAMVKVSLLSVAASVALFIAWPYMSSPVLPNQGNSIVYNKTPLSTTVNTVDTISKKESIAPKDSLIVPQPNVNTQIETPVIVEKGENLDDLLAKLSVEELMQIADNGDDDHFIND